MVSWPAGHRWEDCQVTIYAKDLSWSATLGSAKRLRYNKRLYGGYGAMLTFELRRDDPWVAALTDGQLHWIKVLEDKGDGSRWQTFAGFQIKRKDGDALGEDEQYIEFTFLPMPRMAFWRVGIPVTGETLEVTDKVDDAFKWIIERTLGATAPVAPTTSAVRAFTDFSVAADKSEYPSNVELKATGQNIYEFLQLHGAAYGVDWDIYFDASDHPEFETWYPRRGLDRTEGNGVNTECIFTDAQGSFKKQEYQYETTDVVSNVLDNRFTKDVGDTDVSDSWLYRETAVPSANEVTMAVELADRAPKRSWTMSEVVEAEDRQWGLHFDVGDKVTVYSTEFGYTMADTVCDVTVEYDDAGFRVLTLTFGDPTPDNQDNSRGGGRRRLDPEYTDPRQIPDMALTILPVANSNVIGVGTRAAPDDHQHLLSLTADDASVLPLTAGVGYIAGVDGIETAISDGALVISGAGLWPEFAYYGDTVGVYGALDEDIKFGVLGGTGCSTVILESPDNTWLTINTVWQRDTVAAPFLASATAGDKLLVNTVTLPDSGTFLYVDGHIRLNARLKSLDERLYLEGAGGIVEVNTPSTDGSLVVSNAAAAAKIGLLSAGVSYISGGDFVITDANDFQMYASAYGADMKFRVDGATGNLWLDNAAVTEFGGYEYTWPLDGAVTGDVLTATVTGGAIALSWEPATGITIVAGVTGRVTQDVLEYTIDSHAVVSTDAPGDPWEGMLWLDTDA